MTFPDARRKVPRAWCRGLLFRAAGKCLGDLLIAGTAWRSVAAAMMARRLHSSSMMRVVADGPAAEAVGLPHRVTGIVRLGARRGRVLGFPTANLQPPADRLPPDGVYAGWVRVDAEATDRPAMLYVGSAPTFGAAARRLEVHLFDFSGNLYGRRLHVSFDRRVAAGRRHASPALLAASIGDLAAATREVLGCPARGAGRRHA